MNAIPTAAANRKVPQPAPQCQVLLLYCSADIDTIDQAKSLLAPTGLFFLAAQLAENGISVAVENFSTLTKQERRAVLMHYRPQYLGLSMLTMNRYATMALADWLRTVLPEAHIIIGGPHASALPQAILRHVPAADAVVMGEGEDTLLDLIRTWEQGGTLQNVNGIAYRQNERIIHNPPRPFRQDLSALPHPGKLFAYEKLSTSRGCPFQCVFCSSSHFWGRGIRYLSAEWVVDEIEYLYHRHGIRELTFNDDVFTTNAERLIAICRALIERNLFIRFRCMSRVNTLSEERLTWLKRAGCYRIDFGVETGSAELLQAMGKKASAQEAENAFAMTRAAGIHTGCFIIVGFPGENDQTVRETRDLVRRLRPTWIDFSSMAIFPDSPIYLNLLQSGQVNADVWFQMQEHTLFLVEGENDEKYRVYLESLRSDYRRHEQDYQFTTAEYGRIQAAYPGLGHAALEMAQHLGTVGDPRSGLKVLTQAVAVESQNPFLWYQMAEYCFQLDDPALGVKTLAQALELQPQNYESRRLSARLAAKAGKHEQTLAAFDLAIGGRPEKIDAYLEKGEMLFKMNRFEEAAGIYRQAQRIDPYWPPLKNAIRECEDQM